jgi:hypothetical protein
MDWSPIVYTQYPERKTYGHAFGERKIDQGGLRKSYPYPIHTIIPAVTVNALCQAYRSQLIPENAPPVQDDLLM